MEMEVDGIKLGQKYKPKRDRHNCWRCDSGNLNMFHASTKLVGGYNAHLCPECLNDWDVYISSHELYLQLRATCITQDCLSWQICHDGRNRSDAILEADSKRLAIERELFMLAEMWTDTPLVRPVSPPPEPTEQEVDEFLVLRKHRLNAQIARLEREIWERHQRQSSSIHADPTGIGGNPQTTE